jgi:prolyl-tRNA editing enzyme YbaK/EbsC (Cys-tRNA(Pro) deacylase)
MTNSTAQLHPGVEQCLEKFDVKHRIFECDPALADTAAFCAHYGFDLSQSANAIITASKVEPVKFACCVVLANCKLDVNKKVCQLLGVKKASFASAEQTLELSGMQIGGVTPFGLSGIPIYVDSLVMEQAEIVVGGGNRSSKVLLDPKELIKIPDVEIIAGLATVK